MRRNDIVNRELNIVEIGAAINLLERGREKNKI